MQCSTEQMLLNGYSEMVMVTDPEKIIPAVRRAVANGKSETAQSGTGKPLVRTTGHVTIRGNIAYDWPTRR